MDHYGQVFKDLVDIQDVRLKSKQDNYLLAMSNGSTVWFQSSESYGFSPQDGEIKTTKEVDLLKLRIDIEFVHTVEGKVQQG